MAADAAMAFFVLVALFFVGMGAVALFLPAVDWDWTKFGNDLRGVKSERGEGYEAGRILRGVVLVGVGLSIGVLGVGWAASAKRQIEGTQGFLTATVATPTALVRQATALAAANAPLPTPEPEIYVVVDTDDPGGGYRLAPADAPTQRIEQRFLPIGFVRTLCGPNEATAVAAAAKPAEDRERELLLGQRVRIAHDPLVATSSTYDRWVYIWPTADNVLFNRRMIAEGYYLARDDVPASLRGTPYRYLAEFRAAEDEARAARRGIWGDPACGLALGTRVAERNTPTPYVYRSPTPVVLPTSRPDATP